MPIYPFYRGHSLDRRSKNQSSDDIAARDSHRNAEGQAERLRSFITQWIRISWGDILGMIFLALAENLIYKAPLASTRTFPITFTGSGDIVYPSLAYPDRGWTISPRASGLVAALVPMGTVLLAQFRIRSFWDMNNAAMGIGYALLISTLFQVVLKVLVGGLRPYFLDVCRPDVSSSRASATGRLLNGGGVGFRGIMYTAADVCTNPDAAAVRGAMMSFPSGHATAAFAGFGFLFLWANAKLKVWADRRTSVWWLALAFAPLLAAALQACVLTVDMAHHWYDILAGAAIGTAVAFASYRAMYASVFDWRYNHIPLRRTEAFGYASDDRGLAFRERDVFVRKHGWGRKKMAGRRRAGWLRRRFLSSSTSTKSRTPDPRREKGSDHGNGGDIQQPNMAKTREEHGNAAVVGDELV